MAHAEAHDGHAASAHAEDEDEILAADEQPSPMWLPLLGMAVALVGLILFLVLAPEGKSAAELQKEATEAAAKIRAAQAPPPAPEPAPAPMPAPGGAAAPKQGG